MAPTEYKPMYPGPLTGTALQPHQPGYIIVRYCRSFSDGYWGDEPLPTWRESNNSESSLKPDPILVALSYDPFAVSPKSRIKQYAQAARCRMTQVRRSEVWFTERKAFKP